MSSTKSEYKMHDETKEGKYRKDDRKKCLKIGLIVTAAILISVAIAAAIAIGVGVEVGVEQSDTQTGLRVHTVEPFELEGEYQDQDGRVIHFFSVVNSTHVMILIFKENGELVVTIKHPIANNMTLMSVSKANFFIMKDRPGRPKYDDYLVPDDMMEEMDLMMINSGEMTDDILNRMDNSTVNQTREEALSNLAMSPHAQIIIDAARALGDLGIIGSEYPAVMRFYLLALRLSQITPSTEDEEFEDTTTIQKRNLESVYGDRYAQQHVISKRRDEKCSKPAPITCPRNRCPEGKHCVGMCGRKCECWAPVCGDCCVHEYCRTHDICCGKYGFYTWWCFYVVWDYWWSTCEDTYYC